MDLNIQMVVLGKSHILHGLIHTAVVHFDAGDDFRVGSVSKRKCLSEATSISSLQMERGGGPKGEAVGC